MVHLQNMKRGLLWGVATGLIAAAAAAPLGKFQVSLHAWLCVCHVLLGVAEILSEEYGGRFYQFGTPAVAPAPTTPPRVTRY